jgi:cobalt-zinc-cadmium efflux system protein
MSDDAASQARGNNSREAEAAGAGGERCGAASREPMGTEHRPGFPRVAGIQARLAVALALAGVTLLVEIVGGLLANSLALLADAVHVFSDVAALGLALFAVGIARRPPTSRRTYGYYRAEILAALANGAALIAIAILLVVEAYRRFREPPAVQGGLMMAFAAGGLAANLVSLRLLSAGTSESLNLRGAWLHVLTDTLGSIGALAGGGLIWAFHWHWADPVISVAIGLLVIYSAWELLAEAVAVLLEGAPGHIDVDHVREAIVAAPRVAGLHDLHVWTVGTGLTALSCHVVVEECLPHPKLLGELQALLHDRFGIDHATLQLEPIGFWEKAAVC